jgi:hypothetical protein
MSVRQMPHIQAWGLSRRRGRVKSGGAGPRLAAAPRQVEVRSRVASHALAHDTTAGTRASISSLAYGYGLVARGARGWHRYPPHPWAARCLANRVRRPGRARTRLAAAAAPPPRLVAW